MKAIAILLCATAAHADVVSLNGSTVTLQPTTRPGAIAEMTFDNRDVNSRIDYGDYELALPGLPVHFGFAWNISGNDDAITVTPPPGFTCLPTSCVLQLPEDASDTLWLFSVDGTGM